MSRYGTSPTSLSKSPFQTMEPDRSFEKLYLGFDPRLSVAAPDLACIMHGILRCICDEI